jgi:large subunit ribosomal protein L1
VRKATMSSTMGPGVPLDPNRVKNLLAEDEA